MIAMEQADVGTPDEEKQRRTSSCYFNTDRPVQTKCIIDW
jgi:hypothetical protein